MCAKTETQCVTGTGANSVSYPAGGRAEGGLEG